MQGQVKLTTKTSIEMTKIHQTIMGRTLTISISLLNTTMTDKRISIRITITITTKMIEGTHNQVKRRIIMNRT